MAWLQDMLQHGSPAGTADAPAHGLVDEAAWTHAGERLAPGEATRLPLGGGTDAVAMAGLDAEPTAVLTLLCPTGRFPPIPRRHPPAMRLERTIRDLYGLQPLISPDTRR